jgi:plasmid stability protein
MTISITIRDVPDTVHNDLAARAARSGKSLQEYLKSMLIDIATRPSLDDVIARARARVETTGIHVDAGSILDARDAGRR